LSSLRRDPPARHRLGQPIKVAFELELHDVVVVERGGNRFSRETEPRDPRRHVDRENHFEHPFAIETLDDPIRCNHSVPVHEVLDRNRRLDFPRDLADEAALGRILREGD
jgi:hypothetical protein